MTISKITDHSARALDAQIDKLKENPRIRKLVEILADEVQLLENVLWDVLQNSLLTNATGGILDEYGEIFDEPRGALGDADYRRVLQVVIGAHQSDGDAPQTIYLFATLVDATVRYCQQGRACFELTYETSNPSHSDPDWLERIQRIAEILRPAGVEMSIVEADTTAGAVFQFDGPAGTGFDQGHFAGRIK